MLVREADELMADVLRPGRWPQRRTIERFLDGDRLERVLALYREAMRLDPLEPAYPWNLASALRRLGLNDLALSFVERAIRVAQAVGDEEWTDASVHLAWAEIALAAEQFDVALVALARAKALDPETLAIQRSIARLLRSLQAAQREPTPEKALAEKLAALSS